MWRRLVSSTVARMVTAKVSPVLTALQQYGVGVISGVEHTSMQTRLWHCSYGTVLQLDARDDYNTVVTAVQRFVPCLMQCFPAIFRVIPCRRWERSRGWPTELRRTAATLCIRSRARSKETGWVSFYSL